MERTAWSLVVRRDPVGRPPLPAMIGNRSTLNAVKNLDTLIRSRSPEAFRIAAQNPQLAQVLPPKSIQALRLMILTDPTLNRQNQQGSPVGQSYGQQAR